mmetsp:Transcript_28264/g.37729  ORF Transcript_28264/g.37729 Transcript_28264/m.37729 type:complete len:103 (+) Transcript_28264:328-636(+)
MIRGMMRSMSEDPEQCHSCLKAYKQVYFSVLSMEQIYDNWQELSRGVDGSYRIFKNIVNIYERLDFVNLQCKHRDMWGAIRNKVALPDEKLPVELDYLKLFN